MRLEAIMRNGLLKRERERKTVPKFRSKKRERTFTTTFHLELRRKNLELITGTKGTRRNVSWQSRSEKRRSFVVKDSVRDRANFVSNSFCKWKPTAIGQKRGSFFILTGAFFDIFHSSHCLYFSDYTEPLLIAENKDF